MTELPTSTGTDFVGYRIEAEIGRGGMGAVYRAFDLRLERTVALKLIAPELALDNRFRERFARETQLVMSLEHPNVVPIYDAGGVDGRLYLAMRLVAGIDLRDLLRIEAALEPGRALAVCRQVANALDAAHAQGLVHRDVKPSNILLDEGEHVYLADFGLTRRLGETDPSVADGRSLGTPGYLAPEQIEGQPVDSRADVYALGCVLFECLTGSPPFATGSRLETAWAHLEQEPPRVSRQKPGLPEGIDAVIAQALAKDPEKRFATCGALITAAESALGLQSAKRRRTGVLVGAASLVVALAATGAIAAVLSSGGHGHRKVPAPLFAGSDTLARVNPATNRVSAVIQVGPTPILATAGGHAVWVYNRGSSSVSEIDARTNRVVRTRAVPSIPVDVSRFAGPVLAANASAAWFVGNTIRSKPLLTKLPATGDRMSEYRLDITPTGVAVDESAVWVVGRGAHDYQVLRIDPATGKVVTRTHFQASSPVDSIALGYGAVWVVGSATLYRIDGRTGRRTGRLVVGTARAGRPEIMPRGGDIWIRQAGSPGAAARVDPSTLTINEKDPCCTPDWGEDKGELGALWWYSWQTGSLFRQEYAGGPVRQIHITRGSMDASSLCITSVAIGSGSLWLTATSSPDDFTCPPG